MPIVNDDGVFENELEATIAATPLPPELMKVYVMEKGTGDVEDRTGETELTVDGMSKFEAQTGIHPKEFFFGYPRGKYTSNPLAQQLGYNDISSTPIDTLAYINNVANANDPWKGGELPPEDQVFGKIASHNESLRKMEMKDLKEIPEIQVQKFAEIPLGSPTEVTGAFNSVDWSKLNQEFGTLRSTSKEDTPVVATTASPLVTITEGDISEATNVAMGAGPASIIGQKARLPEGAAVNLGKAMSARAFKEDPAVTLRNTGWYKGADDQWRYEISDEGMKLVDKEWKFGDKGKLGDFIEHSELFKAYPEFKDMKFEVGQRTDEYIASFNPNNNTLKINPSAIKSGDEGIMDVIIHEVQHAIQIKEGFARGSNPTFAAEEALAKLAEKIYSMPHSKAKLEAQDLYFQLRNNKDEFGQYMYLRSPGEIEANIVSARRKLSDELRKKFPVEDHKKIVEGEVNTTHGGKYLPEFWYPKSSKGPVESAMARSEYPMDLENQANLWAQGKMTNKELKKAIEDKGWKLADQYELQRSRKSTIEVIDPQGNYHELQP